LLFSWDLYSFFTKRWIADGHLTAVMKDKGAERAKEVLNRKVREHKPTELPLQGVSRLRFVCTYAGVQRNFDGYGLSWSDFHVTCIKLAYFRSVRL
jgi:hypothetical protein